MKRDMDLCREILRRVEEHDRANEAFLLKIEGRSAEEISYHVKILGQADLLEIYYPPQGTGHLPIALTWAGCEFMEATRDDRKWNDVKTKTLRATGALAFEGLKSVISALAEGGVKALMP
jgi:hypothetical protein